MSPWEPRRPSDEHDESPYDDTPSPEGSPTPETSDMSRTPAPDLPRLPELGDDDLEQLLRGAFEERTRAEVPDDRVPPAIEWPSARAARRTWLTPLAVAASIAVVAAGGGLALAQQHRTQEAPPATQSVTAEPTSASPTSSGTPSTTSTGTATGSATGSATRTATGSATTVAPPVTSTASSSTTTATGSRVDFAGGVITLPAGWQGQERPASSGARALCVGPTGSALPSTGQCVISVVAVGPPEQVDTDSAGGLIGNSQYCGVGSPTTVPPLREYRDVVIGGRSGEYRRWVYACQDGSTGPTIEQYQVATPLSVIIWSEQADRPGVHEALTAIATDATLAPATSTTRLYDHGVLRSVTPGANGSFVLAVDRVITGWPNASATTYDYTVPGGQSGTLADPTALIGKTVAVFTDGTDVVQLYAEN